jgi:hypothetical protein
MIIEAFSLSELGIFIGSCCAGLSGFIYSISKSRCTTIKCCCFECDRAVLEEEVNTATPRPQIPS